MTRVLTPADAEWPERLDELAPLPPVALLYVLGRRLESSPAIAIVGTRRPTGVGVAAAERFATGLAEAGVTVVSGLAVGIDAAAHRASLQAGGSTTAVLGCGLDVDYPHHNKELKKRIVARGTAITEHPQGTPPAKHHFPRRNRIIAGLCDGVLVVEGAITSGALVTARLALDSNRSVYALPGSVANPMAQGPNELIRTGQAQLVTEVAHIFEDLAPRRAWAEAEEAKRSSPDKPLVASDIERAVLRHLDDAHVATDRLAGEIGIKPGKLAAALSLLEVRGLVARDRGGYALTATGARARG